MKRLAGFSMGHWWSIVLKEFMQLKRDRLTLGMIVGLPLIQLFLFGFVINSDPKQMPTAIIDADRTEITRTVVATMKASGYFHIIEELPNEEAGRAALAQGKVLFVLNVPAGFTRSVLRGERPSLLVEADATDPTATGLALASVGQIPHSAAIKDLTGPLANLTGGDPAFGVQVHALYNPEGITTYNIVPGLMGVVLTMTMVLMTGLAITRERERGTMENLLAMPVRPLEVMTGKIVPYIAIGLIQVTMILVAARLVFQVPFAGSVLTMYLAALLFVAANLTVGITISSFAKNQLQAMQLTNFYFLPNMMLSGFLFPFLGMPKWAQLLGDLMPLTYFNRLVRGIFLKGNNLADLWPSIWPLLIFTVVLLAVAVKFYRRTLD
ncbi:MAG: ABC transporter permease [Holophaga sp.]|jgi:ABC-2 type transport system permease protein